MTEDPVTYHSEIAREYAEQYPLEEKDESFFELLDTFIDMVGDGRVLDAGCGPGHETQYFYDHGLDALGVDAAEGMIEYAQQHHDGDYHQMDLRDMDLTTGSFDGIW